MTDPAPNAELMRSLGRLVRGLSALFWGLPIALVVCFHTAKAEALRSFGVIPPVAATALLIYGLWQIGAFQKQERVWRRALEWSRMLGLINFGLSPFVFWYNRIPNNTFFMVMVVLLVFSGLLFLGSLNFVLQRLGAMLPDEALRLETRQFTALNLNLLVVTLVLTVVGFGVGQVRELPPWLGFAVAAIDRGSFWFLVLLVLLPLAMTMALIWKTKEVILDSIFHAR